MAVQSSHHVTVDAAAFSRLFHFHRIWRAITMAMQPPRLVVGLLMIAVIITGGRAWDGFTQPVVSPDGLMAGKWTGSSSSKTDIMIAEMLRRFAVPPDPARTQTPDPEAAALLIRDGYATIRAKLTEPEPPPPPPAEGAATPARPAATPKDPKAELARRDAEFLAAMDQLDTMRPKRIFEAASRHVVDSVNALTQGVLTLHVAQVVSAIDRLFIQLPINLWKVDRTFTIIYGLFFLTVIGIGGGALSRMAACEFAIHERLRVREAFGFAVHAAGRLILAPMLPLLVALLLAVVLAGLSLLLTVPWLNVIGGLLYGVMILLGFTVAFLLLGWGLGFTLLLPAVAVENGDAADAKQRAFAYVLSRPIHLLCYGLIALAGLAIGYFVVSLLAVAAMNITTAVATTLASPAAMVTSGDVAVFDLSPRNGAVLPLPTHAAATANVVYFWERLIVLLVAGYVLAYYFSASTILYLLIRRAADGQSTSEIWRPGLIPGTLTPMPAPIEEPQ